MWKNIIIIGLFIGLVISSAWLGLSNRIRLQAVKAAAEAVGVAPCKTIEGEGMDTIVCDLFLDPSLVDVNKKMDCHMHPLYPLKDGAKIYHMEGGHEYYGRLFCHQQKKGAPSFTH